MKKEVVGGDKMITLIVLKHKGGAYGLTTYKAPESILKGLSVVDDEEPDIYPLFINQMIKATRKIFGL